MSYRSLSKHTPTLILLATYVALIAYLSLSAQHFATSNNVLTILQTVAVIGIIAAAQTVAVVEAGASGLTGGGAAKGDTAAKTGDKPAPKKKGFGIGSLLRPGGEEKKSAEVTGSAASRGVDRERNATGGPVKTAVVVTVTAEDLGAFKKEGQLR